MLILDHDHTDTRELAFLSSDPAWDGRFVAAVRTTGIFCRPSCRVRKPLARNVEYFDGPIQARAAGYRPCLRCHPEAARRVVTAQIETPLGPMIAGASEDGVCLLEFTDRPMLPGQLSALRRRIGQPEAGGSPHLDMVEHELEAYFRGELRTFTVPLDAPGSAFQEAVWGELRRISHGSTITYGELAERIGTPRAVRAVGRANGANRIAIVIPCHRVVATGGRLGGYGGGLQRKARLLALEGAALENGTPSAQ